MVQKNNFYVSKPSVLFYLFGGYSWATGKFEQDAAGYVASSTALDVKGYSRFIVDSYLKQGKDIVIYYLDDNKNVISEKKLVNGKVDVSTDGAPYVAYEVSLSVNFSDSIDMDYFRLKDVNPYYKDIKKQYKKESNQMFFRESLNGTITLRGSDYEYVNNISIEDNIGFYIYRNGSLYSANEFNKTDCKINHSECSIELKLKPKDKYDKILNDYDKTQDLLKMPIRKSAVTLTKRCVIQLYFQGDKIITNYAGGTYWEDEVIQPIYDAEALLSKYYFSKNLAYREINLSGFNYDINTIYKIQDGKSIWNGTQETEFLGNTIFVKSCILFRKIYSKGDSWASTDDRWLSDGNQDNNNRPIVSAAYKYLYDMYRIEIYFGEHNGGGRKIYQSESIYANDSNFLLEQGQIYKMVKVSQDSPYEEPNPASFYLGEKVTNRYWWGRLLCDVNIDTDGMPTYDLPYDDFATERINFKKCIGLQFKSSNDIDLIRFVSSDVVQDEPTPFGVNDNGKYFVAPRINGSLVYELHPYPLARSLWANTSIWVGFEENEDLSKASLENFRKKFYKTIIHKDCMEIGAVIKALLAKIDSTIKFDSTSEYSEFLYGYSDDTVGKSGQRIFITQKSNVLKGEYDQAAKKGEITFGQVMNMLKNCFRCYWYIDSERRFRIEHIRYFINGLSYSHNESQYDLTRKFDKFNKKSLLYGQDKVSFSKSDLKSRYEFAWSDDTTEMMGGGFYVDVKSNYVEQGGVESINVELFTSDIDFMMFAPERFSQDGFALMVTDSNNKIPIIYATAYNQQNPIVEMANYVQNYNASFLHLFNNYLYDMPAQSIISSADSETKSINRFHVTGVKKFVQQEVRFQSDEDPDIYKLIGTHQGNGSIEELSIDIDTRVIEATLCYEP